VKNERRLTLIKKAKGKYRQLKTCKVCLRCTGMGEEEGNRYCEV
jgi:hypothetical protein